MRKWFAIGLSLLCSAAMVAQTAVTMADLPYFCDFEEESENTNWVLNPSIETISTLNAWYVGSAEAYTGEKALYVSSDSGLTASYATIGNVLLAYRDVSLDRGTYDVAFDWMGMGNGLNGYVKVVFEARDTKSIKCLGNSVEPAWVSEAIPLMGGEEYLGDADSWQHIQASFSIPRALANAEDTRVFFIWVNNKARAGAPATIVIDNFQLAKASATGYPENIHVSTYLNYSTVSWTGGADSYEVLYRRKGDSTFVEVTTDTTEVVLNNVPYGAYEFWICGVNGEDKTVYTIFPTVYIYETDCFDVLNMYNADFEYGKWAATTGLQPSGYSRIDYGPDDIRSRQTTHFDTTEIDPRTIIRLPNKDTLALRTVPQGEAGSVRIGNWNTGSEYEQMSYHYTVESDMSALLLLKYAMVLENPDHSAKDQPRFTLTITDTQGNAIDTECGDVDFHAPTSAEWSDPEVKALWHESTASGKLVHWQDWRMIGINLGQYVGKELIITFTSYDCDQGGHFGYAYFTLRCARTDVDGIPWGNDAETQLFTAPGGFNYAWFNQKDTLLQDTISTDRFFEVSEDDENDYICYATYPTNPDCGFSLEATAKPHSPIAEIQYQWVPENCQNGIFVRNACHLGLYHRAADTIEHRYDERMDNCRWTMPDGQSTTELYYEGFYVPVSDDGDTLTYSLWTGVWVNDSVFQDSVSLTIVVPAIGAQEVHLHEDLCNGESIEFPVGSGICYNVSGDYKEERLSLITGCDSTTWMHLNVIQPLYTTIEDTICAEGEYWFVDEYVSLPKEYTRILPCQTTGCDSIVTLHLARAERPVTRLLDDELCGDDALLFEVAHAEWMDSLKIEIPEQGTFVYTGRQSDLQCRIEPGIIRANSQRYQARLYTYMSWCDTYIDTCSFNMNISSDVVEVVLGNVFAIKDTEHNGGYDMTQFQWYADGEPITGATHAVLYAQDMPEGTVYTVQVVLADGTPLWICPFTIESRTPIEQVTATPAERYRKYLKNGLIYIDINGQTYNLLGTRL